MAKKLQQSYIYRFWKEVRIAKNSRISFPSSIDGITGADNIAELWRRQYEELFNCVQSEKCHIGNISYDVGVVVRPYEVSFAIGKLSFNKACGHDQITAENLKYASHSATVLLAICFSGLKMHGALPNSMMSVLLVPVIKDETYNDAFRIVLKLPRWTSASELVVT